MSEIDKPFLPDDFFPKEVSYVLLHPGDDVLEGLKLHTEELELASSLKSLVRQQDFLLGRKAAQLTLNKLGISGSVLRGSSDEPIWPQGVLGSISHSGRFAICAATICKTFLGIGIDIEFGGKNSDPKIAKRICTESEIDKLPEDAQDRLAKSLKIFSAKEAYYKAVFPSLKKNLGFRDVELEWDEDNFEARIINPKFSVEKFAVGKVSQGGYLISVCYLMSPLISHESIQKI